MRKRKLLRKKRRRKRSRSGPSSARRHVRRGNNAVLRRPKRKPRRRLKRRKMTLTLGPFLRLHLSCWVRFSVCSKASSYRSTGSIFDTRTITSTIIDRSQWAWQLRRLSLATQRRIGPSIHPTACNSHALQMTTWTRNLTSWRSESTSTQWVKCSCLQVCGKPPKTLNYRFSRLSMLLKSEHSCARKFTLQLTFLELLSNRSKIRCTTRTLWSPCTWMLPSTWTTTTTQCLKTSHSNTRWSCWTPKLSYLSTRAWSRIYSSCRPT